MPASGRGRGLWHAFWPWAALAVIAAAAAAAAGWRITSDGLEVFYAAAVRSMAGNWHDFWYASSDPHGTFSLDKLPGPFWVQALSVRAFGLSVWAMVLPQVVWTVLTVVALFVTVRRIAGPVAGLAAAALFAISPVTAMSARGNVGDPLFVLLSVLAADAVLRAVGGRPRWLLVAAVWAGLAFQVKMAEAWLLAAVLALAYLIAGPAGTGFAGGPGFAGGLWRRAARLAGAAPVLAVVSLAWMVFVALTPARSRPYADGSEHNSVFAQVFDYNGIARFSSGSAHAFGMRYLAKPSAASVEYLRRVEAVSASPASQSHPAWDRLLTAPVAQLTGWLLVPALVIAVAAVVAVCRARGQQQRRAHAPLLVWGLWLLVFMVVFSVSRDVQAYYFTILTPAIAALCALAIPGLRPRSRPLPRLPGVRLRGARLPGVRLRSARLPAARRRALAVAGGVTVAALCSAGILAEAGPPWRWAGAAAGGTALAAGAGALALTASRSGAGRAAMIAARVLLALTAAAGLAGPLVADGWGLAYRAGPFDSLLTPDGTFADLAPSVAAELREYHGYGGAILPQMPASRWRQFQQVGQEQNRLIPPGKWLAVYASTAASAIVLGGARRVLPIGGFTGLAPVPTAAQLTRMLDENLIVFAITPGPEDTRWNDPRVQAIVRHCLPGGISGDAAAPRGWDCRRSPSARP